MIRRGGGPLPAPPHVLQPEERQAAQWPVTRPDALCPALLGRISSSLNRPRLHAVHLGAPRTGADHVRPKPGHERREGSARGQGGRSAAPGPRGTGPLIGACTSRHISVRVPAGRSAASPSRRSSLCFELLASCGWPRHAGWPRRLGACCLPRHRAHLPGSIAAYSAGQWLTNSAE